MLSEHWEKRQQRYQPDITSSVTSDLPGNKHGHAKHFCAICFNGKRWDMPRATACPGWWLCSPLQQPGGFSSPPAQPRGRLPAATSWRHQGWKNIIIRPQLTVSSNRQKVALLRYNAVREPITNTMVAFPWQGSPGSPSTSKMIQKYTFN